MKLIKSYDEVMLGIKLIRDFKESYLTNFFPNKELLNLWIDKKILYIIDTLEGAVFFVKKNDEFNSLYFAAKSEDSLSNAIGALSFIVGKSCNVVDIIGKGNSLNSMVDIFTNNNFTEYTRFTRMYRLIDEKCISFDDSDIVNANEDDVNELKFLLDKYFDNKSEQIPFEEEILRWIKKGHVFVKRNQGNREICGFVIFDIIGVTSYLRYWFVHPEHRDKKIGSKLLKKFFCLNSECKKQIFWVLNDNDNAIKRYLHYGFKNENMIDIILIKNI